MSDNIFAVIMAGGSGTRFWPASRAARPKQFLPISGARPMIEETVRRLDGLVPLERILVVTAASQADLVRAALPELPAANIVAEPEARNTAACVALAARAVSERDPDAVQIILPADHIIEPTDRFQATLEAACRTARSGDVLVTFGIQPDHPATGYGYIEVGQELERQDGLPVYQVQRFVEKPDLARAEEFLASGRMLWNSGMFAWTSRSILAAYRRHLPDLLDGLESVGPDRPLEEVYLTLPSLPVDIGILEKADNVRMLAIDYRWSDVGSWDALPEVHPPDSDGNHVVLGAGAKLVSEQSSGCVVYADGDEVVALVGVEGLVVVRSGDATLICPRGRTQEVKKIVDRLKEEGGRAT